MTRGIGVVRGRQNMFGNERGRHGQGTGAANINHKPAWNTIDVTFDLRRPRRNDSRAGAAGSA
jgi:hypothetical protein